MWVVAVIINGLTFVSLEPFNSQEACELAAVTAHLGECVEVTPNEGGEQQ